MPLRRLARSSSSSGGNLSGTPTCSAGITTRSRMSIATGAVARRSPTIWGTATDRPRALLPDVLDQLRGRRLVPHRGQGREVHRHPLAEQHGVEPDVVLGEEAIERLALVALGLLDVQLPDPLDLGDHLAGRARAHAQELLGEHERRDLEEQLGEPDAPGVRIVAHHQPVPAVAAADRLADPRAVREPDLPVLLGLEIELLLVADLAEQPGVERDELERLGERDGALVALDLGDRRDGLALGVDQLLDDELGLAARARAEPVGALAQLLGRALESLPRNTRSSTSPAARSSGCRRT